MSNTLSNKISDTLSSTFSKTLPENLQREYDEEGENTSFDAGTTDKSCNYASGKDSAGLNGSNGLTDENSLWYEFTFSILQNRFNQVCEEITRIRTQSVFILTVVGFLVSCSVGLMGANWFNLDLFRNVPLFLWILLGVVLLASIVPAALCLFRVTVLFRKYYLSYPAQDMYMIHHFNFNDGMYRKKCVNINDHIDYKYYIGLSVDEICTNLRNITYHNMRKNQSNKYLLWISTGALLPLLLGVILIFVL